MGRESEKQSQTDPAETFKAAIEDAVTVIEKLADHCDTPDEMLGMLRLALENSGQFDLLMKTVLGTKK